MNYFIEDAVKPTFGGHEKFVFRNGWLKKGVDGVREDRLIFTRDEALVTLGVGKNMVRSIRHWCLATGPVQESPGSGQAKPLVSTELAEKLILGDCWDPYFEDAGSLWLIHWQLVSNLTRALVWSIAFSAFFEAEFSKKQLQALVTKQFERLNVRTTEGTIEREIDCLLHTYVPAGGRKGAITEENLDCPLAELDLIQHHPEENVYRFNIGAKPSLPTAVFGYALFHYLGRLVRTRRTVAVEEILYQGGSPGQAFKLDENSVIEYLERLEGITLGAIRLNETAGLRQVYLQEEFVNEYESRAMAMLEEYYDRN